MASLKHTHTYERSPWSKNVYRCADPGCTHYNHKLRIVGKKTVCTQCKREFVLTSYNLKTAKPKCELCSDTKVAKAARAIAQDLELQHLFSIEGEVERARELENNPSGTDFTEDQISNGGSDSFEERKSSSSNETTDEDESDEWI